MLIIKRVTFFLFSFVILCSFFVKCKVPEAGLTKEDRNTILKITDNYINIFINYKSYHIVEKYFSEDFLSLPGEELRINIISGYKILRLEKKKNKKEEVKVSIQFEVRNIVSKDSNIIKKKIVKDYLWFVNEKSKWKIMSAYGQIYLNDNGVKNWMKKHKITKIKMYQKVYNFLLNYN